MSANQISPQLRHLGAPLMLIMTVLFPTGVVTAGTCWAPPIQATIIDEFRDPQCPWCPGNRGLEYDAIAGQRVTAVAAGTVTFAGPVAGTLYVVVQHGDGRRATYGRLASHRVVVGDVVLAGQLIGASSDRFYFGLRHGDTYIDPAPLMGRWRYRIRLVPVGGSPGRPAAPRLACATGT